MSSRLRPLAVLLIALSGVCLLAPFADVGGVAGAVDDSEGGIEVVQIDGLIDPANRDLLETTIRDANRADAELLVIKIASGGALDANLDGVVRAIRRSRVPIATWIGPAGAKGKGAAVLLSLAAPVAGVSSSSAIGPADPLRLDEPDATSPGELADELEALNQAAGRDGANARRLVARQLSTQAATRLGITDQVCPDVSGCPTIGDFIVNLDGKQVITAAGTETLSTAKVIGEGRDRRRQPNEVIRFRKLDLAGQAVHTLTSPSIAYFLLVAGLALIVFEFFTISVGLAGGAGALAVIGAFVGFAYLPVNLWAVALILVAMLGYSIDVQAGRPYAWTVISSALLIVGSVMLYGGSARLDVHWWVLAIVILGTIAFMVGAMPVAVRSRFSTPTIGREALIGEIGEAVVDVDPDGVVLLRGARWRARTNRATPIESGDSVRVIEVSGLVLEVEPEAGGARDYRDHSRRSGSH